MKRVKLVMTAGIAFIGAFVLTACVKDEATGETSFSPVSAVQKAASTISDIPDESKATLLEGLACLLGATGIGAVAVPLLKTGAGYFRNKGNKSKSDAEASKSEEDASV